MALTYPDLPLTSYPDTIQEINNVMDVNISTLPLVKQFNEYLDNNDLASAQALVQNNPNLDANMLNAKKYNILAQTIIAMQRFITRTQQQALLSSTEPTGATLQASGDIWLQKI